MFNGKQVVLNARNNDPVVPRGTPLVVVSSADPSLSSFNITGK